MLKNIVMHLIHCQQCDHDIRITCYVTVFFENNFEHVKFCMNTYDNYNKVKISR